MDTSRFSLLLPALLALGIAPLGAQNTWAPLDAENFLWHNPNNWGNGTVPAGEDTSFEIGGPNNPVDLGGGVGLGGWMRIGAGDYHFQNGTLRLSGLSMPAFQENQVILETDVTSLWEWGVISLGEGCIGGNFEVRGSIFDRVIPPEPGGEPRIAPTNLHGIGVFSGENTYTGTTWATDFLYNEPMRLAGLNGSIRQTESVLVAVSTLDLDNSTDYNPNRVNDAAPLTLRYGTLRFQTHPTLETWETLGAVSLESGLNRIELVPGAGEGPAGYLSLASLGRENRATLIIEQYSPGSVSVLLGSPPAQFGSEPVVEPGEFSTQRPILPWATAPDYVGALGSAFGSFLTYEAETGLLRPLEGREYAHDLSTATEFDNVELETLDNRLLASSTAVQSLVLRDHLTLAPGATLTVASGGLLSHSLGGEDILITGGADSALDFADREGILHVQNGRLTVDAPIAGSAGLTLTGPGQSITLNRANPFSGGLVINGTTVISLAQGALGSGPIQANGTTGSYPSIMRFGGVDQVVANPIQVYSQAPNSGGYYSSALAIEVEADRTVTLTGPITGDGLYKDGPGTMIVQGTGDGGTSVAVTQGQLVYQAQGYPVQVWGEGLLTGNGTVSYLSVWSGTVDPGNSAGRLIASSLLQSFGGTFHFDLDGVEAGVVGGYDQIVVGSSEGSARFAQSPSLFLDLGFSPTEGTEFRILDLQFSGALQGTFLDLPEGTVLSAAFAEINHHFRISYQGGDGNDVVLTAVAVPEPASAALLLAAAAALAGWRGTRKSAGRGW